MRGEEKRVRRRGEINKERRSKERRKGTSKG
jgi:hypothetical protein